MSKITTTKLILTGLALYGAYRVVKAVRGTPAKALPPAPQVPALPLERNSPFAGQPLRLVDWTESGTVANIERAIKEALEQDWSKINGPEDLAWCAGARLWPGASIHPSGLDRVRMLIRDRFRWEEAEDSDQAHAACVRLTVRGWAILSNELLPAANEPGTSPADLQAALAGTVFPEYAWPPTETSPALMRQIWDRCAKLVEVARSLDDPNRQLG